MKHKIGLILCCCVVCAAFALGAGGSVSFAREDTPGDGGKDKLVGVFITTEYLDLFDFDSYSRDNAEKLVSGQTIRLEDSAPYQGRLYASLVDDPYVNPMTGKTTTLKKFVFEGAEGIGYFSAVYEKDGELYRGTGGDEAISDSCVAITSTDAGDILEMQGTIYASTASGPDAFYMNPVYQTPDGQVYAVTGQGVSYGGERAVGMSSTKTIREEETVTVNGKPDTVFSSMAISTSFMDTPTGVRILQFDGEGGLAAAQDCAPGALPDSITAAPETAYIIVETILRTNTGAVNVSRELFQPANETLYAFFCREDGICVKQHAAIVWPAA